MQLGPRRKLDDGRIRPDGERREQRGRERLRASEELGDAVDEESPSLRATLKSVERAPGQKLFSIPVALSILVFFALCCQCGATLATIKRETNSWRWPAFAFGYMLVLAWTMAFAANRVTAALVG